MDKKAVKIIKTGLLAFFAVFVLFFYRCPIKLFTGTDCPGCGMTRAFKAAICFDFQAAFDYHPLFWLLGAEIVYLFISRFLIKKTIPLKIETAISVLTLILLLAVWIYRIFFN